MPILSSEMTKNGSIDIQFWPRFFPPKAFHLYLMLIFVEEKKIPIHRYSSKKILLTIVLCLVFLFETKTKKKMFEFIIYLLLQVARHSETKILYKNKDIKCHQGPSLYMIVNNNNDNNKSKNNQGTSIFSSSIRFGCLNFLFPFNFNPIIFFVRFIHFIHCHQF